MSRNHIFRRDKGSFNCQLFVLLIGCIEFNDTVNSVLAILIPKCNKSVFFLAKPNLNPAVTFL